MKKVLSICLILAIILGMTACSGRSAAVKKYGEEVVSNAEKAISFTDEFLNNTLDSDIVYEKLKRIEDNLSDLTDQYRDIDGMKSVDISFIYFDVSSIAMDIYLFDSDIGTATREEIKEKRDELAEKIGK